MVVLSKTFRQICFVGQRTISILALNAPTIFTVNKISLSGDPRLGKRRKEPHSPVTISPIQVLTHAARAAAKPPLVAARGAREGLWLE